jgi:hypothetical protein
MPVPEISVGTAINLLYAAYYYIRSAIMWVLENTVFVENPDAATLYADSITFLASITAIYLILEFFATAKRIVRLVMILGWLLLIVSLVAGSMGGM